MHEIAVTVQDIPQIHAIIEWLKTKCVGKYSYETGLPTNVRVVKFQLESDFINFTLTWS